DGAVTHAVAEGNGPVNALDKAVRMALRQQYPEIAHVELHDFKVRLLDESSKTAAMTRVLIESGDGERRWGTVGVSSNIIEASWRALVDSLEYKLHLPKTRAGKKPKGSGGGK
ncbi:MAG: citramalate synthase, partial [Nitrospinota bacterium]|nr:citramalate synthase [Nitrospinota bacterium]